MSDPKTSTEEILVHLVRPDVGERDYRLADGATLADLLRLSGISISDQAVLVNGVSSAEELPLREGVVITVASPTKGARGDEAWRKAVPAFRDEALFQEYSEALKARGRELDSNEGRDG